MLNDNEKKLINLLNEIKRYVKGELELDCVDDKWFAMDYREDLGGAFLIESDEPDSPFDNPVITVDEAEYYGIDVVKCCNEYGIFYVG